MSWKPGSLGVCLSEIIGKVWSLLTIETWWVQCVLKGTLIFGTNANVYHCLNVNISPFLWEHLLEERCSIPPMPRHIEAAVVFWWWWLWALFQDRMLSSNKPIHLCFLRITWASMSWLLTQSQGHISSANTATASLGDLSWTLLTFFSPQELKHSSLVLLAKSWHISPKTPEADSKREDV